MPTVRALVAKSAGDNYKLKTIIEAITATDVFRMNVAPGGANGKEKRRCGGSRAVGHRFDTRRPFITRRAAR